MNKLALPLESLFSMLRSVLTVIGCKPLSGRRWASSVPLMVLA